MPLAMNSYRALIILLTALPVITAFGQVESPSEFADYEVGVDGNLLDWSQISDYLIELGKKSPRVQTEEIGKTTEGRSFLLTILSSESNLRNLAKFRNLQRQGANPRQLSDDDAKLLARASRLFVAVRMHSRSHEIAAGQAATELAYKLAISKDPVIQNILDQVVILMIPSTNPDGVDKLADWCRLYAGTPYEGSPLPELIHIYAGDEYLEDGPALNLLESRLQARSVVRTWQPHIAYEQEQGKGQLARLIMQLPDSLGNLPYPQLSEHLAGSLKERDVQGLALELAPTPHNLGALWCQNATRVVASVASAQLATPVFFPRGSLREIHTMGSTENRPGLIDAWEGGWWHLRNVMTYEIAGILAFLELAASQKESIIYAYCKRNLRAIKAGQNQPPYGLVVPRRQHDPIAANRLIDILVRNGVEVYQASREAGTAQNRIGPADYIIPFDQPLRFWLQRLLSPITAQHDDSDNRLAYPEQHLAIYLGVRLHELREKLTVPFTAVKSVRYPPGKLLLKVNGHYLFHHTGNQSFVAANRLLREGKKVYCLKDEIQVDTERYEAGSFYVPANAINAHQMDAIARELSIEVRQTKHDFSMAAAYLLKLPRSGLYLPWTPTPDAGWTKRLLDAYDFSCKPLTPTDIRRGGFAGNVDVIILPDMITDDIINGSRPKSPNIYAPRVPQEYEHGIAETGVDHLKQFAERGGTLIALGRSCDFAISQLGLPVRLKALAGGDTLLQNTVLARLAVNTNQAVAYGMPAEVPAVLSGGMAFAPLPWRRETRVVSYFTNILELSSGHVPLNEIAKKPAVLEIPFGNGRIILIAIRAQFRAQTQATLKFLFNSILLSNSMNVIL